METVYTEATNSFMISTYVLVFAAKTGRFLSAHLCCSADHATGLAQGVGLVPKFRRAYVYPRDKHKMHAVEQRAECTKACHAAVADERERSVPKTVEAIDVDCDSCPGKAGDWCKTKSTAKAGGWVRRRDGFHSSRVQKARLRR